MKHNSVLAQFGLELSRRDFLRTSGQVGLGALLLPQATRDEAYPGHGKYEYAAGGVTLPFSYSVSRSSALRPAGLDFASQPNPDNCQVFVRIEDETWEFRSKWIIGGGTVGRYRGPGIDHMIELEDGAYPQGLTMCWFLGGMWCDTTEHKLYAPMHVEQDGIRRSHPVAAWGCRKIILATSTNKGKTWRYEGDIITAETYYYSHDVFKFSGSSYGNGVCDFGFYADTRGGYFYIFPDEAWLPKGSMAARWNVRAARCAITDKMIPGKWRYFYEGKWDQPALGGKSSSVAPSHLWGVIYSSYLDKYICMFPSNQDPVSEKNIDGVFMGACSDLSKQDWTCGYCPEAMFGFITLMNAGGTDVIECGQTFRYYAYGGQNTFERLDVKLEQGQTISTNVHSRYLFEPHPESSDPLQGRMTKIVGASHPDIKYSGTWIDRLNSDSYEGLTKESPAANSSMEFSFEGSDVYWRAVRSPSNGKADVYLDGVFRRTVDCYSPRSTSCEQFVYIRTGLAPGQKHTIKIVVRDEKHSNSEGTKINHVGFEYSAESYKASAGFCSLMGKNNWYYQRLTGSGWTDLRFVPDDTHPKMYWLGDGQTKIGNNYQVPGSNAVRRKWVAPHGGVIRIEGRVAIDQASGGGILASIRQNESTLWPERPILHGEPSSHDLTVKVEQDDAICFVAAKSDITASGRRPDADKLTWDPVITYTRSIPAVWRPNPPSPQNLAANKYARSRRPVSSYRPFDAVDGDTNTAFIIEAKDKISSGEDWFLVDLDRPNMIDRYVLVSEPRDPAYRPASLTLQSSDDGFTWVDVDSVIDNTSARLERDVPAFRARFVRLYLPKGKPFTINEFELYYTGRGSPAAG